MLTAHKRFTWLNALMSFFHRHGETVTEQVMYFEREVNNRRDVATRLFQEFIFNELAAGVRPEDLTAMIAENMTKGLLPTVLEHKGLSREGYRTYIFLTTLPGGIVPPEAVKLSQGDANATVLLDGPVYNNTDIPSIVPGFENQYHIDCTDVLISTPSLVDDNNVRFLKKMDAHIPAVYPLY